MYRQNNDSQRPLATGNEYGDNAFIPEKKKTGKKKWIIGGVLLVLVAIGVALGVYFGVVKKDDDSGSSSGSNRNGNNGNGNNNPTDAQGDVRLAVATDSWGLPEYPSTTNTALLTEPTFVTRGEGEQWPQDDFTVTTPSFDNLRPHPRLIAPQYKWDALPDLITNDPYIAGFHESIMANATIMADAPVVAYVEDGGLAGSGILDVSREKKVRVKYFAYAYRMTQETRWVDRAWRELVHATGTGEDPWGLTGEDLWNTAHFLDLAEMTAAFAIGYDWLYDVWTPEQRDTLRNAIVTYGLNHGLLALNGAGYGWWARDTNGNWNCVSNGGLILGALAIYEDDTTGVAAQILPLAIESVLGNCVQGASADGSWSESPNYWYFGTTGAAELTSALMTATGGDHGILGANPGLELTGLYHMYVAGMTSLFEYGDHGPNKFSATANALLFFGEAFDRPEYQLFQRDRHDAAEPFGLMWYDPRSSGAFWNGLPLDHHFDAPSTNWVSMRSSWTDNDGIYVGFKASGLTEHHAHGDLDAGTFVIDALGQRFAGEHGNADYLGPGYFSSEEQDSVRWLLYRKMTEGQNVISINGQNQLVAYVPDVRYESSGTEQGSSTVYEPPTDSTAYSVADLSTAYGVPVRRGIRFINGRRQVLVQDELTTEEPSQWRVQTNATITINDPPTSATLELGGKRLTVQILDGPAGVGFTDLPSTRTANAPTLGTGQVDEDNSPARVLAIDIPAPGGTLVVVWNPEWDGFTDFASPATVALDAWSLDSH